jgi:hypothetical protein
MNNARIALAIMSIFSFLFGGCGKHPKVHKSQPELEPNSSVQLGNLPEVFSESEEGFHDLVFYIQDYKKLADGTQTIRASGIYKSQEIGLDVVLGSNWNAGSLLKNVPIVTYRGQVIFRSIGTGSDSFLKAVDQIYGTKFNPPAMKAEVHFTGITLGGDPCDLLKALVKIKLFYEVGGNDSSYAELFTNIKLGARKIYILEKDESYRPMIVKALNA